MSKFIVTIRGPVSSMKSTIAGRIAKAFEGGGQKMTATVFDHELFEFDDLFTESHECTYRDAAASESDVSIIVIGTGVGESGEPSPLDVRIEPAIPGSALLLRLLSP
jgi:nicotinamide riboside kinase